MGQPGKRDALAPDRASKRPGTVLPSLYTIIQAAQLPHPANCRIHHSECPGKRPSDIRKWCVSERAHEKSDAEVCGGCSSCPSEYSVRLLAAKRCRPGGVLSEFAARSEFQPDEVPRYWFGDPTLPLAISSALWFSFTGPRWTPLSDQCTLSSSSAFLQSLPQHDLASQPQPVGSSHGLSLPTALQGLEVHLPRALPEPATFRPQGLVTLSAGYSLRARAGLFSCRRRSWDSPFGAFSSGKVSAAFPGGRTHAPFIPSVSPGAEALGRPNEPRPLGFDPSRSPSRPPQG